MIPPLSFKYVHFILLLASFVQFGDALASIVTGANGFVGRAVVHELLDTKSSDEIICLVRPQRVQSEEAYWSKFDKDSIVRVLPYDMLDGGKTFQEALKSCGRHGERCVFHIASVFGPTEDHEQTALDNVKGAEDLVNVLARDSEKCRLVLTSSMAAVRGSGQEPANGEFYTYKDWNNLSVLGANWGASYQWSKMESERRAVELCGELGIPLTVLNPSFVFGPARDVGSSSSFSLELAGQWVRGESPVQSRLFVDARDLAKAHVAALKSPVAAGKRYLLSTEARVPSGEIAEWMKEACRRNGLFDPDKIQHDADFDGGAIPIGAKEVDAADRLREELGIELRPVKETIMDMTHALLEEKV